MAYLPVLTLLILHLNLNLKRFLNLNLFQRHTGIDLHIYLGAKYHYMVHLKLGK